MTAPAFEIEITSQGWFDDDSESFSTSYDLCTHGQIRLVIGGEVISAGDDERDFTISTSALTLLRTLESDHELWARPEFEGPWLNDLGVPLTEKLIMHCGNLAMMSCPIGIDWCVTHQDGYVRLSDVVRVDDRGEARYPGLEVELPFDEYRGAIVAFAKKAKEPFAGVEKELDDFDRDLYPRFWAEYDGLLARNSRD